jgi:hypothetical protein
MGGPGLKRIWTPDAESGLDDHNGKLIGLIAIGDSVFNLSARDNLIKWDVRAREERLTIAQKSHYISMR